jgi:hypothetical protein
VSCRTLDSHTEYSVEFFSLSSKLGHAWRWISPFLRISLSRAVPDTVDPTKEVHMHRRLYFIFSDKQQAQQAVTDLTHAGVDPGHIHALAHDAVDLGTLPAATGPQRRDLAWRLENVVWRSNLALFALGLLGLLAGVYFGSTALSMLALTLMLATSIGGALFAHRIPDAHLDEFRGALAHGDIVLLVDVPRRRHGEIDEIMRRRHPEAVPAGSSWTIDGLGI